MTVIRPADPTETAYAWLAALRNTKGPTAILLTRHNVPVIDRAQYAAASNLEKGAYVLWQSKEGKPQLILMATGSEVQLALDAAKELAKEDICVRVVSMPSWELFETQPERYKRKVLPPACKRRISIEAGITKGWERYVGTKGASIGLNQFGASGPYKVLAQHYGFTVENVLKVAKENL
jgi:transketolase